MRSVVVVLLLATLCAADARKIKALILLVKTSKDSSVRWNACKKLGQFGPTAKRAAPTLVGAMGDYAVRNAAAAALKRIGDGAIPAIVKGLKSRKLGIREGAAALCDKPFGPKLKIYIPKLITALKDESGKVRSHCAAALGQLGKAPIGRLVSALGAKPPHAGEAAARALARLCPLSINAVEEALRTGKSSAVRANAAVALGYMFIVAKPTLPTLFAAMDDPEPAVRSAAAVALCRIGEQAGTVVPRLVRELEDRDVHAAVVEGLVILGKKGVPELVKALHITRPATRDGLATVLARAHKEAMPGVLEALGSKNPETRRGAIAAVMKMNPVFVAKPVSGVLAGCLTHDVVEVRVEAALALARMGQEARRVGAKGLRAATSDEDPRVRAAAVRALGEIGGKGDVLKSASTDRDPAVRIDAAVAQWQTGVDAATTLGALRKEFATHTALAAEAFGRMGFVAEGALPDLIEGTKSEDAAIARACADAIRLVARPSVRAIRKARTNDKLKGEVAEAVDAGVIWLARHQTKAAGEHWWDADGFMLQDPAGDRCDGPGRKLYDVGVTSLALLAFMAAGRAEHECVPRGLDYLAAQQDGEGCIGSRASQHFIYNTVLGTLALVEAWIVTGNPRYRRAAQRGIAFICYARNPFLAWRYEPRGGENDTSVTAWSLTAIRLADLSGIEVDRGAYAGAGDWIDKVTDPEFGQVGYNMQGGSVARPEGMQDRFPPEKSQAMTAAALWCRHLLGKSWVKPKRYKKGVDLCLEARPIWNSASGTIDLYYWHYGSLAMFQDSAKVWKSWVKHLQTALLSSQHGIAMGSRGGSWDPIGVWCIDGGRVYSTAINVLSLLTEQRYPRGFVIAPKVLPDHAAALRAADSVG